MQRSSNFGRFPRRVSELYSFGNSMYNIIYSVWSFMVIAYTQFSLFTPLQILNLIRHRFILYMSEIYSMTTKQKDAEFSKSKYRSCTLSFHNFAWEVLFGRFSIKYNFTGTNLIYSRHLSNIPHFYSVDKTSWHHDI